MSETHNHIYNIANPRHGYWRIIWEGDFVDSHPAEKVEQLFLELNRNPAFSSSSAVDIDLTNCGIVNSGGIAFLIYFRRRSQMHGNQWALSNVPLLLHRMLLILNLESAFKISSPHAFNPADAAITGEEYDSELREETEELLLTVHSPTHT